MSVAESRIRRLRAALVAALGVLFLLGGLAAAPTVVAQDTTTPEGVVLGEDEDAPQEDEDQDASEAEQEPEAAAEEPEERTPTESTADRGESRSASRGAGSEMPNTGFFVVPMLLLGALMVGGGIELRRRTSRGRWYRRRWRL